MNEVLNMGMEDRDRLCIIRNTLDKRFTQAEAARMLCLSYRQVQRICAAVRQLGDRGILHGLCGQASNNRLDPELLGMALSAMHHPLWYDFGPVFCVDKLEDLYGIKLSEGTVRRLMILTGLWTPHRRGRRHRAWRERRRCIGMLVQLDGSDHDWFEGRGPRCVLIIYIDDATSRILYGEFAKVEDTLTLLRTTRSYLKQCGRPVAVYVDKDSIYNVNRPPTVDEQLNAKEPITQFTRAMGQLGVEVILANSPQAKGRVERGFDTHQDRLVKELRLRGIVDIEQANRYLWDEYIPEHNTSYAVEPIDPVDSHKPLLRSHDLNAVLSIHDDRQVQNDSIVRYKNRFLLLSEGHGLRPRTKVIVQERLDGTLRIERNGRCFEFKQVPVRPYVPEQLRRARAKPNAVVAKIPHPPRSPFRWRTPIASGELNAPASAALA